MKISVIIPVGDMEQWRTCESSISASAAAYRGSVELELLPCFDLEHRGAFAARNEGLCRATGDWIAWVDCDDTVEPAWFSEIAAAALAHPEVDILQFDAIEVKAGRERAVSYGCVGEIDGDSFARELLRNDGMPAWLWTRLFRRPLFGHRLFAGRVKQDYRMFLEILPDVRRVWSLGKPLYRYFRHGSGLSSYAQYMDYGEAGRDFEALILALPSGWRHDAEVGLALTMADVARHSGEENGSRKWVRKYLPSVLRDMGVPLRLKAKALCAAAGI